MDDNILCPFCDVEDEMIDRIGIVNHTMEDGSEFPVETVGYFCKAGHVVMTSKQLNEYMKKLGFLTVD